MTALPDPSLQPDAFLSALHCAADPDRAARDAGCVLHGLGAEAGADPAATARLHAAGARAIAATLARGASPLLLLAQADRPDDAYAAALVEGLMGYERIHVGLQDGWRMILVLPPTGQNAYWRV